MNAVNNSNNILSLSILLLGIIVVVITLGIGGKMAKAELVNDNSNWICWPECECERSS
jgi:hypothetical protein